MTNESKFSPPSLVLELNPYLVKFSDGGHRSGFHGPVITIIDQRPFFQYLTTMNNPLLSRMIACQKKVHYCPHTLYPDYLCIPTCACSFLASFTLINSGVKPRLVLRFKTEVTKYPAFFRKIGQIGLCLLWQLC